jgi:hypothetical protein
MVAAELAGKIAEPGEKGLRRGAVGAWEVREAGTGTARGVVQVAKQLELQDSRLSAEHGEGCTCDRALPPGAQLLLGDEHDASALHFLEPEEWWGYSYLYY